VEQKRAPRSYSHYDSQEEEQEWRMHQYDERRHPHQPSKPSFAFIKLPSFNGESDPNVYLGWEAKVEQIFNVYEVQDDQKVRLASLKFLDYVMQWWHKVVMDIGLNKKPTVVSWDDLKLCMCARFVLPHFRKELLLKLQRLQQRPKSVDEYFKDLETTLTKIDMHENEESKIARSVSGLRRETQDVVELF